MYRRDFGIIYCKITVYQMNIKTWSSRVSYFAKSLGKTLFYLFRSPFQTIDRNIFLSFENNGTQVIQPDYMIIMLMCEKHCIYIIFSIGKHLLPEIRPAVYQYFPICPGGYQSRASQPFVFWVRRQADRIIRADYRNTLGSSCS